MFFKKKKKKLGTEIRPVADLWNQTWPFEKEAGLKRLVLK